MVTYKNEIINTNNIAFIKDCYNALCIHFVGGTNHWIFFDDEKSKKALLTSIELRIK